MKYTAINIGPILSTFNMVTRPRELWAASYLFSYLMSFIIKEIEEIDKKKEDIEVFSPIVSESEGTGVGLYPDRVYCKGSWNFPVHRDSILKGFSKAVCGKDVVIFKSYFNIMCVSVDGEGKTETMAIKELNQLLDIMELNASAISNESRDYVWGIISNEKKRSLLYEKAFIDKTFGKIQVKDSLYSDGYQWLAQYAAIQLKYKWEPAMVAGKDDFNEDVFFQTLNNKCGKELKTHHKYICIVQADGDNMGKAFSHKALKNGDTAEISKQLVEFGKSASKAIYAYGGLPVYAGGDDLLFIAPVVGHNGHIFSLIDVIDNYFKTLVTKIVEKKELKDKDGKVIVPSMSYGISVTYYKFPLYEALKSAQSLLFNNAKNIPGKGAIALDWRKHSGGAFKMELSKNTTSLYNAFKKLISDSSVDDAIVSAIGHKLREQEGLIDLWLGLKADYVNNRNKNLFQTMLDHDPAKTDSKNKYKGSVLNLLNALCDVQDDDVSVLIQTLYGMIRIAQFIHGEEVKNA